MAAPHVTRAHIDAVCSGDIQFHRFPGTTVTVCCIILKNGFAVTGESACVSLENFDVALGESLAYENAKDKVWMLEGYALKDRLATT